MENGGGVGAPLVGILKNGSASSLGNSNTQQTAQTKLTESASNGTIPKEIKEEEEESSAGGYIFHFIFADVKFFFGFRFKFLFILSTNLITRMQW